jgi:chaperonin GroES
MAETAEGTVSWSIPQAELLPIWQHEMPPCGAGSTCPNPTKHLKNGSEEDFLRSVERLARQLLCFLPPAPLGSATAVFPRQAVPGDSGRPAPPLSRRQKVTPSMSATATKPARKKSTLIPLGDRVVVEREASEQKTSGGILLPDSAKDKPARGTIVSVGEGKCDDKGVRHPLQVKPGDRVVFTSYAGEPFKVGDEELLLMREDDILAILG